MSKPLIVLAGIFVVTAGALAASSMVRVQKLNQELADLRDEIANQPKAEASVAEPQPASDTVIINEMNLSDDQMDTIVDSVLARIEQSETLNLPKSEGGSTPSGTSGSDLGQLPSNPVEREELVKQVREEIERQEDREREDRMKQMAEERITSLMGTLEEELQLSAAQKMQIEQLMRDQSEKISALFQNSELDWDERREQMGAIRDEFGTAAKALLTEEQSSKFDQVMEDNRGFGGRRGGRGNRNRGGSSDGGRGGQQF
jgi:hypothetical protein